MDKNNKSKQENTSEQTAHLKWGRKRVFKQWIWFFTGTAVLTPVLYVVWSLGVFLQGFQPLDMALAQFTPKDVVGDLGGMPVIIPRHYAEYVQYDDEPDKEKPYQRRISSFGMDVRFPDMKGLENWQIREEKRNEPLSEKSWLYVGVNASSSYYGPQSLNRRAAELLKPEEHPSEFWWVNYIQLPEKEHGLEVYVVAGNDPDTGEPARESSFTKDIYLELSSSGDVETYISCGRRSVPHGIDSCHLSFLLEPKASVYISARFRRGLLPEWRKMKNSLSTLLMSFEKSSLKAVSGS